MANCDVLMEDISLQARFMDGSCMSIEGAETVGDVRERIAEGRGLRADFREVALFHRGSPLYLRSQRLSELGVEPGEEISVVCGHSVAEIEKKPFRFEPPVPTHLRAWRLLHSENRVWQQSMSEVARLEGPERQLWIAAHTLKAHEDIARIAATLGDLGICTHDSCPSMRAGEVVYRWKCEGNGEPREIPAPEYAAMLVSSSNSVFRDASKFPHNDYQPIPESFEVSARQLLRRFFRVFAHAYLCHFDQACFSEVDDCIHVPFRQFVHFVTEFSLVSDRDMAPLQLIVQKVRDESGFAFLRGP
eukprot:TRINITY_DN12854_c0_g1_i1.p1 TRINITY_DN12854_c0_g1~~TRINITY_DN12854_c0_g1_i1.p1  ORF type:complete len:334 (-),score=43.23 TRINITY_DN12854_c0_g1_i1:252-1160(-)